MVPADRIPIWTVLSRRRFLRGFRDALAVYYETVRYEAFPFRVVEDEAARTLRTELEPQLVRCRKVVHASGAVSLERMAPGERSGDVDRVNLVDVAFGLHAYNLQPQDVLQALDAAEAEYGRGVGAAWIRTLNPFYWVDVLMGTIESLPFLPLRWFGVPPSRAAKSRLGRGLRAALRLGTLVGLGWGVVWALGVQGEVETLVRDLWSTVRAAAPPARGA